jgi:hypothetical protein
MKYVAPAIKDFGSIADHTFTICFPSNQPGGSVECLDELPK